MRKLIVTLALAVSMLLSAPASAAPTHNETTLSFFSCGATRPDPDGPGGYTGAEATVNHSHLNAADSNPGHWDAYDCEDWIHVGQDGCVWRVWYIYDNGIGIFGPANVTCWASEPSGSG